MFSINELMFSYSTDAPFGIDIHKVALSPGSITAVLGANGCGKTTLYRLLSGAIRPNYSALEYDGQLYENVIQMPLRLVFHNAFNLLEPSLTVAQHLSFHQSLSGLTSSVDQWVDKLALGPFMGRRIQAMSAGQQHRVKLLLSLSRDPDVIFFDEPTTGSDLQMIETILQVIKELKTLGKTVLISTHHLYEIAHLEPAILGLNMGKVIINQSWDNAWRDPKLLRGMCTQLIDRKVA